MRTLVILATAMTLAATMAFASSETQPLSCGRGWVFFDLGNTLIDTSHWDRLTYMPRAHDYLHELRKAGFHIGVIANIPESWGVTENQKITTLKNEIIKAWSEPTPFEWDLFEIILLPMTDQERKPAPVLFAKARQAAGPCPSLYQGEDPVEVRAASESGHQGYIVGKNPDAVYAPIGTIFPEPLH